MSQWINWYLPWKLDHSQLSGLWLGLHPYTKLPWTGEEHICHQLGKSDALTWHDCVISHCYTSLTSPRSSVLLRKILLCAVLFCFWHFWLLLFRFLSVSLSFYSHRFSFSLSAWNFLSPLCLSSRFLFLKDKIFHSFCSLCINPYESEHNSQVFNSHGTEMKQSSAWGVKLGQHDFCLWLICTCSTKYLIDVRFFRLFVVLTALYADLDLWYLCPVQVSFNLRKATAVTNIVTFFNKVDRG